MALSPEELQLARDLKAKGVTNTMIMGHIAQTRAGKPSLLSESVQEAQPQQQGAFSRALRDAPSDLKEGAVGLAQDFMKRGQTVYDAGQARIDGEQGFGRTAFQQLGQVAGGVGDIISRTVMTGAKLFTTPETEQAVGEGLGKVAQDTGLVDAYQKLQAYKDANPAQGRDIDATLGILEMALDRFGLGKIAKGTEAVVDATGTMVDATKQGVRSTADALGDIKMPNMPDLPTPVAGATQQLKEFGERIPRAIGNKAEDLRESAIRAERIRTSSPGVAQAIKAEVPEQTIKIATEADAPTRQAMRQMLDVAESGERNARPARVAGEAVAKQYSTIDNQRKAVGKQLEEAINNLPDATVDMRLAYRQLDDVLAQNDIRVRKDGTLDFTKSELPTQQRTAIERLYNLTREAGDIMDARTVHKKDRMFSAQKRTDMKTDMLDDIRINVNGKSKSIYDTFRDIYRNQLDNLDNGSIRSINKEYAILRNAVDEADNSIFKSAKTKGLEVDPEASAMVNLRRIEGDALSTPYFQEVAGMLDDMSRQFGYSGAKPVDLIRFAEDLRTIYPETIPATGFQGGIRTALGGSKVMELIDSTLNAGKLTPKDQQKALRAMLDDLLKAQDTPTPPISTATRQPVQKTSSPNSTTERGMINPSAIASDIKAGARKVWDAIRPGDTPNKERGMINVGAMADDLKGGTTADKIRVIPEPAPKVPKQITPQEKDEILSMLDYIRTADKYDKQMTEMIDRYARRFGFNPSAKKLDEQLEAVMLNAKIAPLPGGTRGR